MHPEKSVHELQRLSDTRWACRHNAVNAICCTYDALPSTLQKISNGTDRAKAIEAAGLLAQVNSFKFLLSLIVFDRVLTCTKSLSDCLQNTQLHLAKAADLVAATISTLEVFRTESEWNKLWAYAEKVAEVNEVEVKLA